MVLKWIYLRKGEGAQNQQKKGKKMRRNSRTQVCAFLLTLLMVLATVTGDLSFAATAYGAEVQATESVAEPQSIDESLADESQPMLTSETNESEAQETVSTLAGWTYQAAPEGGLPAAATTGDGTLSISGAVYGGYSSKSLKASNWSVGSGWVIAVDATDYSNLTFSTKMRSSATGPGEFALDYSLDEGASWNTIDGSDIVITSTNLSQTYSSFALPTALNHQSFLLRITCTSNVAENGGTLDTSNGASNINNIVIEGSTSGASGEPEETQAVCKTVSASVAAGNVEQGTEVALTCETEDAVISYRTNLTTDYVTYTEPIVLTESVTIYAYASKEGMTNSKETSFAYTVKSEETEEEAETAVLADSLADGNVVAIYFENGTSDGVVLGTTHTASNYKLDGVTATPSDGKLTIPEGAAQLTVSLDDDGYYTFLCDGKYLTTSKTGSSLTFADAASDYSLWKLAKADENGGYYLINANAKYNNTSEQYLEYYNAFTTYSYYSSSDSNYVIQFYRIKEGTPTVKVDTSVTATVAQWAGNANYDEQGVTAAGGIAGDVYETNDMKETDSVFTAVVSGKTVQPYTSGTSSTTGSTSYYMGGKGIGSGSNDYLQFALSSRGYGNMNLSFRMRASNGGAGSYQLQYSTDGSNFTNFTTGTYSYKYTAYSGEGSSEVSKSGDITDGIAKTSYAPTYYVTFTFDVPDGASNADKLYIRLVPGAENASGSSTPSEGGTVRIDSVVLSGNPVVSSGICGYVQADPAAGNVAVGSELTLSSATGGATIYYSVNDGAYQQYDSEQKPVLEELPLSIRTYAVKEGVTDSIKMVYQYSQSQVSTVKATPNGGSVTVGTKVTLTCDTEGATICYSSDGGNTWEDYDSTARLVLDTLPATYQVKAVKEGSLDSNTLTLNFTERENETYNIYFGQLHSHTSYSDGAGSCEDAFQHASNVENLDFLAVTDHSNSFDNASDASITDGSVSEEWVEGHALADQYTSSDFVSIFGYEMTWSNGLGHMNTFNTDGFQSRTQTAYSTYSTALQNYYATIKTQPDSINQFNHPGTTFGDFSDFAYYDEELDNIITLIEVGNGEGAIGSSGYFPSYEYYQRALDKGWHVSPTNNQDNHKGLWGDANTARTVVLADSLTRDNIYDAMRNYRIYATEDNDLSIYYTLDDYIMGSILTEGQTGEQVEIKVDLSDASNDVLGTVQVITNGGLVLAQQYVSGSEETVTFTVDNDYSYYYIKVVEADGDIAVTAPVWVGEVEAAGINSISTDEVLPVKDEALSVDLELYNNENTAMEIDSIEFTVNDEVIHNVDLAEANLTSIASMSTASYSFDYTYDKVGSIEIDAVVHARLNGVQKVYKSVLKLTYVSPDMVTKVIIDGTHYNDYVTGYYGGNVGNFTTIAGQKNIKVEVVTDEITPEMLEDCALLVISAPAKKTGTANAGDYVVSHFSDEFINMVKNYTDGGGTLIVCGTADYQDTANGQTATELNKLLAAIGATTKVNSDEAYDTVNNGGQAYRLYLKGTYNADSKYLSGASEEQEYSAYSGCTVSLDADAVAAGKAEALVNGYDTTYSIDCKDENGKSVSGNPVYVEQGNVVALAHETLDSGANIFVAGTVFISDFEVKAEMDNIWDLPYLNRTIAENILDEVTVELPATSIADVRQNGEMGDVFAIEGYVTAGTSVEGNTFFDTIYVQDDTAGITVFPYATSGLEIGTKVRITGYVDAYQGDKELQLISSKILSDEEKKVYTPEKMSAADAMNYEKSGGKLVQVEGKVVDVLYDTAGTGVSQFWLDDGSGATANIFIDGYIFSGTTGKNELASVVKVGDKVSAVGLVYAHPEGDSDDAVICLRVRNCDEIVAVQSDNNSNTGNETDSNTGNAADNNNTGSETDSSTGNANDNSNTGNEADSSTDSESQDNSQGSVVNGTVVIGENTSWDWLIEQLRNTPDGGSVEINLNGSTVVPKEVFAAIAGRNVEIVVSVGEGIRWRINGTSVSSDNVHDIDFGVALNTTVVPQNLVNKVAGGKTYIELSLNYSGEFGCEAYLELAVGAEYAGKYANLYYYNPTAGKMQLQTAGKIESTGKVELLFTHASDYVIVIDDKAATTVGVVRTGDEAPLAEVMMLFMAGIVLLAYGVRRRKVHW
jgi:hypothetical protein